jgi:hypothetical protein
MRPAVKADPSKLSFLSTGWFVFGAESPRNSERLPKGSINAKCGGVQAALRNNGNVVCSTMR